jgi:hypothetical protein
MFMHRYFLLRCLVYTVYTLNRQIAKKYFYETV